MDLVDSADRAHKFFFPVAYTGPRRRILSIRAILALAATLCAISSGAQAQSPNLWQTYMEAAQSSDKAANTDTESDQTADFTMEAIILDAALAFAKQNDPSGQRAAMTRLPLMLAYGELNRQDLLQPLAALGLNINVSHPDNSLVDYIDTLDNYGSGYDDRFKAHADDRDQSKQFIRYYGAKNSFRLEVALRTELKPDAEIGLAGAMSLVGLVYKRRYELDCAAYDYGRAYQTFLDFQNKQDAMTMAGSRFSVGNSGTPNAEQGAVGQAVIDTQVYLVLELYMDMLQSASQSLDSPSTAAPPTNAELSTKCDNFGPPARTAPVVGFDAQISRALEYFEAILALTSELHKYWPDNKFFGIVYDRLGMLYGTEFEMRAKHPDQYPDALEKAKAAYDEALAILTHSDGIHSTTVSAVATNYVDLLVEAKLPDEAKTIEQRYGVKPSN
jgi:hypothetical protein